MEIIKHFRNSTKSAEAYFRHGLTSRFLNDAEMMYRTNQVAPRCLGEAESVLKDAFSRYSLNVTEFVAKLRRTETLDRLDDYKILGFQSYLSPIDDSRKDDFVLNHRKVELSPYDFRLVSKPTPLVFRMGHIYERYFERVGENLKLSELCSAQPMALILSECLDKKMQKLKLSALPFALPMDMGLLLGIARVTPVLGHDTYRYSTLITENVVNSQYQWQPKILMNVHTFISRNEMFPDQKRLHDLLKGYVEMRVTPQSTLSNHALADYLLLDLEMKSPAFARDKDQEDLRSKMYNLVNSKLWGQAVRMPSTVSGSHYNHR